MNDWKSVLRSDPTEWLLEPDNPSMRFFTLTEILGRRESDPDVKAARRDIMKQGAVPLLLKKQNPAGNWGEPEEFYIKTKYFGTVWNLIVLASLGADPGDRRVRKACEFVLEYSQDRESGAFSHIGTKKEGGRHDLVIPCLTGNMVWSLMRLGYADDPRVEKGIEWMAKHQRFDDMVENPPKGWPYDRFKNCWGRHTCHMGAAKALKALAEMPQGKRTGQVKRAIENGAEYFLAHHIFKRSHDLGRVSKPVWLKFGFPLMWNTDALELFGILAKLGYRDGRMKDAADLVLSKQDGHGRWKLDNTYNGRTLANIERLGKPSKWVTFNAVRALRDFYS